MCFHFFGTSRSTEDIQEGKHDCIYAHCNKYILTVIIILSFILACMLQIRVNFLPVGHTHEDVDQFFSKISAHLSRVGAETINGELIS